MKANSATISSETWIKYWVLSTVGYIRMLRLVKTFVCWLQNLYPCDWGTYHMLWVKTIWPISYGWWFITDEYNIQFEDRFVWITVFSVRKMTKIFPPKFFCHTIKILTVACSFNSRSLCCKTFHTFCSDIIQKCILSYQLIMLIQQMSEYF